MQQDEMILHTAGRDGNNSDGAAALTGRGLQAREGLENTTGGRLHHRGPADAERFACQRCGGAAEIFQVTGSFCLQCWQEVTHPDV